MSRGAFGRPARRALSWAVAACLSGAPALAQDADRSRVHGRAGELLQEGDTARAITLLRERVRRDDADAAAWLDLGRVLSARATALESDTQARLEAKHALERAIELRPEDPFALLEYGLLLRKQRVGTDAIRVLERAWRTAEASGESLPPGERARLHYQLGRIYESWWADWQGLVQIPNTAEGNWSCVGIGSADSSNDDATATGQAGRFGAFAVRCPQEWWATLEKLVPIEHLKAEDRARMLEHFRRAIAADPTHVEASVSLLGHLADAGDWREYETVADGLLAAAPEDPRSSLFMGLGLHRRGRSARAAGFFARGVELLDGEERATFSDLGSLLPPEARQRYRSMEADDRRRSNETIFASKDPLYLTEVNERELEHYARLAWAELKFSVPATGTRGWDADIGRIFIRYGEPVRALQCCYAGQGDMSPVALARFQYWSYGPTGPNFYFWRFRTFRRARLAETAGVLAENLTRIMPERYVPVNPTAIHAMPVQVARFLGSRPDLVRLEFYAGVPLDSLGVGAGDSLQAGVFLFDAANSPVWSRTHVAAVGERGVALTYRVEVPESSLRFAVESRAAGADTVPRPAARATGPVDVEALGPGLAMSDLLLADRIEAAAPGASRRDQLTIVPNRSMTYPALAPVHIYFELYGLTPGDDGSARYEAELTVTEASEERRGVLARVFRGARDLLFGGAGDEPAVSWERTLELEGDRAVDFLRIELPDLEPGLYTIALRVTDTAAGGSATRERTFEVVADNGEGGRAN